MLTTKPAEENRLRAEVRRICGWWLASRLIVLGAAALVQVIRFPLSTWHPSFAAHPFAALAMWDGRWYAEIATRGYVLVPGHFSDPAFYPLLPVLERTAHLAGIPPLVAGAVIANIGFLAGLIAMYALGRELLPEADAARAARYLAVFPMGFVFSMAYPEGIVLPLVAFAGLAAIRNRWLLAAACVAAATLAREEGLMLIVPLAAIAIHRWPGLSTPERGKAVAAVLAGPATLASFSVYLWHVLGDPLAWTKAEHAWGRSFAVTGVYHAAATVVTATSHHQGWLYRDAAFCLVYAGLLVAAWRARVPRSWVIAGAGMVLLPLMTGSVDSDARFGLLALPCFWGLAYLGRRSWVDRAILVASPVLLAAAVFTIPVRFP